MFRVFTFVFLVTVLGTEVRGIATDQTLDLCPLQLSRNKLMSFGDVCLQFKTHKVDWNDARTDCRRHGGDLVTITTQEKEKFILDQLHAMNWRKSISSGVWLGTSDRDKEGTWLWVNGSPMDFGDWHPGQGPSHHGFFLTGGLFEDCALLRLDDHGRWHDYPCAGGPAYHYSYICEYKKIQVYTPEVSSLSSIIKMSTSMPTNAETMSSPMTTDIKMTTAMPTNSKMMTTAMPTNSKMMTTAMPTNSKMMTTAMPTNSKMMTTAMPTFSKIMTTAMPTNSKMMTTAMPTNSKMMTTAMHSKLTSKSTRR